MSKTHSVVLNDRLTFLSIRYYGVASKTALIIGANPQLAGRPISLEGLPTIYPGDVLIIPDETINITNVAEAPTFPPIIPKKENNEIGILTQGNVFNYFSQYNLNQEFDSLDNITISVPRNELNVTFLANIFPFQYQQIAVYYDGNIVFGGVAFPISESRPDSKTISIACYPRCGVLQDCSLPDTLYPIEFKNQTIKQIADTILTPFGIQAIFDPSTQPGNFFKKVTPEPEEKVFNFLTDLAKQRGIILSNTPQGNLFFWKTTNETSLTTIREGEQPFISCVPDFNQQEYYSHITGFIPVTEEKDSRKHTWINNTLVAKGITRPFTFVLEDSDSSDLVKAVEQKAGRMYGSACSYTLTVQGHKRDTGDIWRKNTKLNVLAPGAMIFRTTEFLIKSVAINRTSDGGDTTIMKLVLPGSYSGVIPESLPWEPI